MMKMPTKVPPGLIEKIEAAGYTIERSYTGGSSAGVWRSSNEAEAQRIADSYTLDEAKAHLRAAVSDMAKHLLDKIATDSGYSMTEIAVWAEKERLARQFSGAKNVSPPRELVREAEAAGVTVTDLCDKILENASSWRDAQAAIMGARMRLKNQIDALADLQAAASFDCNSGW